MSGENSYFSRFFVKFVEVSAAGLATAISAYALAHFGGLLSSSPTPASAPASTTVQIGPTASEVTGSRHAQMTPPADAAVNKQGPAPQQRRSRDCRRRSHPGCPRTRVSSPPACS